MESQTPYRVVRITVEVFDRLVLENKIKGEDFELVKYGIKDESYPDDSKWLKAKDAYIKAKTEFDNETYRCRDEDTD